MMSDVPSVTFYSNDGKTKFTVIGPQVNMSDEELREHWNKRLDDGDPSALRLNQAIYDALLYLSENETSE